MESKKAIKEEPLDPEIEGNTTSARSTPPSNQTTLDPSQAVKDESGPDDESNDESVPVYFENQSSETGTGHTAQQEGELSNDESPPDVIRSEAAFFVQQFLEDPSAQRSDIDTDSDASFRSTQNEGERTAQCEQSLKRKTVEDLIGYKKLKTEQCHGETQKTVAELIRLKKLKTDVKEGTRQQVADLIKSKNLKKHQCMEGTQQTVADLIKSKKLNTDHMKKGTQQTVADLIKSKKLKKHQCMEGTQQKFADLIKSKKLKTDQCMEGTPSTSIYPSAVKSKDDVEVPYPVSLIDSAVVANNCHTLVDQGHIREMLQKADDKFSGYVPSGVKAAPTVVEVDDDTGSEEDADINLAREKQREQQLTTYKSLEEQTFTRPKGTGMNEGRKFPASKALQAQTMTSSKPEDTTVIKKFCERDGNPTSRQQLGKEVVRLVNVTDKIKVVLRNLLAEKAVSEVGEQPSAGLGESAEGGSQLKGCAKDSSMNDSKKTPATQEGKLIDTVSVLRNLLAEKAVSEVGEQPSTDLGQSADEGSQLKGCAKDSPMNDSKKTPATQEGKLIDTVSKLTRLGQRGTPDAAKKPVKYQTVYIWDVAKIQAREPYVPAAQTETAMLKQKRCIVWSSNNKFGMLPQGIRIIRLQPAPASTSNQGEPAPASTSSQGDPAPGSTSNQGDPATASTSSQGEPAPGSTSSQGEPASDATVSGSGADSPKNKPGQFTLIQYPKGDVDTEEERNIGIRCCDCFGLSKFGAAEALLWRSVKDVDMNTPTLLANLGLVRFMDKTLFSFTRTNCLYVCLAEVSYRRLLTLSPAELDFVKRGLTLPFVTSELCTLNQLEKNYIEDLHLDAKGDSIDPAFYVLITPLGLRLLYMLLVTLNENPSVWRLHANSIFYLQRVGHHCPWTLMVTPPEKRKLKPSKRETTSSACGVDMVYQAATTSSVERTSYRSAVKSGIIVKAMPRHTVDVIFPRRNLGKLEIVDGGAGTSVAHHGLSPLLNTALLMTITDLQVRSVATLFCSCTMDVNDHSSYAYLQYNGISFPHVTHMQFLDFPVPLHCFKRPNGFFVSLDELVRKRFLPPYGFPAFEEGLDQGTGNHDIVPMLEQEKPFLQTLQMSDNRGFVSGSKPPAWKRPGLAACAQINHKWYAEKPCMQEVDSGTREGKHCGHRRLSYAGHFTQRRHMLLNLLFLRHLYDHLKYIDPSFEIHSISKFFIKLWPHACTNEALNGGIFDTAADSTPTPTIFPATSKSQKSCEKESKKRNHSDNSEITVESTITPAKRPTVSKGEKSCEKESKKRNSSDNVVSLERVGVNDDGDDDVKVIENVEEPPPEVVELLSSSDSEEDDDIKGQGQERGQGQNQDVATVPSGELVRESDTGSQPSTQAPTESDSPHKPVKTESQQLAAVANSEQADFLELEVKFEPLESDDASATCSETVNEGSQVPAEEACTSKAGGGGWIPDQDQSSSCSNQTVDSETQQLQHSILNTATPQPELLDVTQIKQEKLDEMAELSAHLAAWSEHDFERSSHDLESFTSTQDPRSSGTAQGSRFGHADQASTSRTYSDLHDLSHVDLDPVTQGLLSNAEISHIKQEQLAELDADLLAISNITAGTDTHTGQCQAAEDEIGEAVEGDSVGAASLCFKWSQYKRSCSCPQEEPCTVLKPCSILTTYLSSRHMQLKCFENVGQAVIHNHVMYTFTVDNTLYFSIGQLQTLKFLGRNVQREELMGWHHGPSTWIREMSFHEFSLLQHCGAIGMGEHMGRKDHLYKRKDSLYKYMMSAELLSFLSYDCPKIAFVRIKQSDIILHRVGHICPNPRSLARRILSDDLKAMELKAKWVVANQQHQPCRQVKEKFDVNVTLGAWAKSFQWQERLKDVETRRLLGMQFINTNTSVKFPVCSDCSLYVRRCRQEDIRCSKKASPGVPVINTYYVCTPGVRGTSQHIKTKVVVNQDEDGVEEELEEAVLKAAEKMGEAEEGKQLTEMFEGCMIPEKRPKKSIYLKTGVGLTELDPVVIKDWLGLKANTHNLILTGVLTVGMAGSKMFCCFSFKGKLYINWSEVTKMLFGFHNIYVMAKRLNVFLYRVPDIVGKHFARHFSGDEQSMCRDPWLCVNSVNAIAQLGQLEPTNMVLYPKTFAMLNQYFLTTDHWHLRLRNFLLIPKMEALVAKDQRHVVGVRAL